MKFFRHTKLIRFAIGMDLALFILFCDQFSKWALTERFLLPLTALSRGSLGFFAWLAEAPDRLPYVVTPLFPSFNLVMVWNEGISFGMLQNFGDAGPIVLVAFSAVIVCLFAVLLRLSETLLQVHAYGLIIGGALGNMIDRLRFGAVADFFDVYVGAWHWPAFNIADSAITIGVALILFDALFLRHQKQDTETRVENEPDK